MLFIEYMDSVLFFLWSALHFINRKAATGLAVPQL